MNKNIPSSGEHEALKQAWEAAQIKESDMGTHAGYVVALSSIEKPDKPMVGLVEGRYYDTPWLSIPFTPQGGVEATRLPPDIHTFQELMFSEMQNIMAAHNSRQESFIISRGAYNYPVYHEILSRLNLTDGRNRNGFSVAYFNLGNFSFVKDIVVTAEHVSITGNGNSHWLESPLKKGDKPEDMINFAERIMNKFEGFVIKPLPVTDLWQQMNDLARRSSPQE